MKIKKFLILPLVAISPVAIIVSCSTQNTQKPSDQPTNPSQLYDPQGGTVNDLTVDQYLKVVQALELSADLKLQDLDDHSLTQKIQEVDPDATIKITAGSTAKQTLSLKVIKDNQEFEINIKGFKNNVDVVFTYSNFQIQEETWVENLLSIKTSSDLTTLEKLNSQTWAKVIDDFDIKVDRANDLNEIDRTTYKQLLAEDVKFDFSAKLSGSDLIFKIKAMVPGWIYQNGNWIVDSNSQESVPQMLPETTILNIPSIDIVKKYLIEKTEVVESKLATFYPSVLEATIEFYKKKGQTTFIWNDLVKNELIANKSSNPIMKKYFPNDNINLTFDLNNFVGNDWTNRLAFNVQLVLNNNVENQYQKQFEYFDKNKMLQDLEKKWNENPTVMSFKKDSSILKNIIKELKLDSSAKQKIDDFFNNSSIQDDLDFLSTVDYSNLINDTFNKSIYDIKNINNETEHKDLIQKIQQQFDLKIFNNSLNFDYQKNNINVPNNQLMFETGLLNSNNEIFKIENVNMVINSFWLNGKDTTEINITSDKTNNKIKLKIDGRFFIKFNSTTTKTFDFTLEFDLDQTTWNSINATP